MKRGLRRVSEKRENRVFRQVRKNQRHVVDENGNYEYRDRMLNALISPKMIQVRAQAANGFMAARA